MCTCMKGLIRTLGLLKDAATFSPGVLDGGVGVGKILLLMNPTNHALFRLRCFDVADRSTYCLKRMDQ